MADLERSLRFYCGVLGFQLTQRCGTQAAFVSAGGYHHHIGLNTWESLVLHRHVGQLSMAQVIIFQDFKSFLRISIRTLLMDQNPCETSHFLAIVVLTQRRRTRRIATASENHGPLPRRHPLSHPQVAAEALGRLIAGQIPLDGASDHGVSEALYLRDPDDNGVELYWDRPPEAWPRTPEGKLAMFTRRLDLNGLLKEIEAKTNAPRAFVVPRLTNQVVSLQ